ncbi:hypothetical protein RND81_13G164700 [Saponaria officinalis]|uniref:Pentatricopeptide repeat-containing protein n=1 Tax=Saponaria officinalis TaxID=3572 RepID=A0AAW1H1C2_SAPOF
MSLLCTTRRFFRKYSSLVSDYGKSNLQGFKNSPWKNSRPPVRFRKPFKQAYRESNKSVKQEKNQNVDPKVYMRDVVREISNILRYSSWESAQERLLGLSVKWDSFTVNQVLKTHPPMEKAWLFFNWIAKEKNFKHDQYTYTTMIDIFGEAGRINSMKYVLQMMREKGIEINAVTYTSVLHWLSKSGDFDGAVKVWEEMKTNRYPTVVSYTAYMKVLFDNNRADEATDIYKQMLQCGLTPTCHTYTILMVHLISSGKCKTALEVFTKLQETGVVPDKAMCNILVEQCSKAEEAWAIIHILHYMKENSLVLRYPIYLQAHETLKIAGEDDSLLQQVNPHISIGESVTLVTEDKPSDVNFDIDMGLLLIFLRKKNFAAVDCLFAGILSRNKSLPSEIVSEIVEANCDHGRIDAALLAFEYSKNMAIEIDNVAYLSLIGVLIRANEFSKILPVVEQMVTFNLFLEPAFAASLIYRLGQVRELDIAVNIFNFLSEENKSTSTYTALIDACFSAGYPDKGVETFQAMKRKKIQSALATYTILIRGLEMCDRADEARFYRREKRSLEMKHCVSENVLMEENICDTLFSGYMVS